MVYWRFRWWQEWKHNKCEPTEQPCTLKMVSSLVCVIIITHRGLAVSHPSAKEWKREGGFFSLLLLLLPAPLQHPVSELTQIVGYVGNCIAEIRRPLQDRLPDLDFVVSLSLHWVLMWGGIPVRVARHVAVGRHVYSFGWGRHVPDWGDARRARGQGHGARDGLALVRVTALLQQLLELWPFILKPNFYLRERTRGARAVS